MAKPKAHSLTGRITQPLLQLAFKVVQRNRGAAGIDKVSVPVFARNLAENLEALERDSKDGSFVLELHEAGYRVVLDADSLQFEISNLGLRRADQVADGNILNVIENFLRSGVREDGLFKPTTMGTLQHGVISPLLANLVLNHLEERLGRLSLESFCSV